MNGSELYQYILNHTGHNLQGTWETTEQNQLKVTGTNVNGSYVVFNELGALNDFILEWEMTVLASAGTVRINSGISPILLTDPTESSVEGWNNGTITNAKFVYFMCNYSGSGDGNVGTLKSISDNGSMSNVNSSTGSFTVGTKYTYKLVRADGYLRLYQDNNLISEYQETTYADTPFYLGWFMWWGGTYREYQANFIIDNYVITDLSTDTTNYVDKPGLSEIWANIKNYITTQLLGKSNTGHTHVKSEITDFPTIPTKTSDLTNDSGFLTSHQDLSDYIPRSGGAVLNGVAYSKNTSDSLLQFIGGTAYNTGAYIALYGKEHSTNGGKIECSCRKADGTAVILNLSPDGTAKWNGKNLAMQEDTVPRSGGAVMTGDLLASSTINSIGFGYGWGKGGTIYTYSPTHNTVEWQGSVRLEPLKTTSNFKTMQLKPDGTWTWSGTACQITSDQRLKQQITEIDDKLLDAWEDVELCQFKYNDAVEQKGKDKARLHTGFVVQQIDSACKKHGVDISTYGLYCHEVYPEETEEVEVEQVDGTKVKETKVIREASEHYSLRYTEALIVECKYLRRCVERLTARIEELEKGNNSK